MVKQWFNPLLIKIDCHLEVLFLGSHLTSFNFYLYHSGFHWKIRGKYFLQILIRDLIKFEIVFFTFIISDFNWNIRGTLILNTHNNKNRSPCLPFKGCFSSRERGLHQQQLQLHYNTTTAATTTTKINTLHYTLHHTTSSS